MLRVSPSYPSSFLMAGHGGGSGSGLFPFLSATSLVGSSMETTTLFGSPSTTIVGERSPTDASKPKRKRKSRKKIPSPESDELLRTKAQSVSGFLLDIDPIIRRSILAEHYAHCLLEKEIVQAKDYIVEEQAQQGGLGCNSGDSPSSSSFDDTEVVIPLIRHQQHSQKVIVLQEPQILRVSIYEKFVRHFQQFHNEQDALGLVSLVLYPCFIPDIIRETNYWMRSPVDGKMIVAASRSSIGTDGVYEHYSQFFETFSDAILVYQKTTVKPLSSVKVLCSDSGASTERSLTMVITPFTYFLSLIMPTFPTVKIEDYNTTETAREIEDGMRSPKRQKIDNSLSVPQEELLEQAMSMSSPSTSDKLST